MASKTTRETAAAGSKRAGTGGKTSSGSRTRSGKTSSTAKSSSGKRSTPAGSSKAGSGKSRVSGGTVRKNTAAQKRTARAAGNRQKEYVDYDLVFEIIVWIVLGLSVLLFIGLLGFGGRIGRGLSTFCFGLFGVMAYLFPFVLFFLTAFLISNSKSRIARIKAAAAAGVYITFCGFTQMLLVGYNSGYRLTEYYQAGAAYHTGGGFAGGCLVSFFAPALGTVGTYLVYLLLLIIFIILLTQKSIFAGVKRQGANLVDDARRRRSLRLEWLRRRQEKKEEERKKEESEEPEEPDPDTLYVPDQEEMFSILPKEKPAMRRERRVTGVTPSTSLTPEGISLTKKEDVNDTEPEFEKDDLKISGIGTGTDDFYDDADPADAQDVFPARYSGSKRAGSAAAVGSGKTGDNAAAGSKKTGSAAASGDGRTGDAAASGSGIAGSAAASGSGRTGRPADTDSREMRSTAAAGGAKKTAFSGSVFSEGRDLNRNYSGGVAFGTSGSGASAGVTSAKSSPAIPAGGVSAKEMEKINEAADRMIRASSGSTAVGAGAGQKAAGTGSSQEGGSSRPRRAAKPGTEETQAQVDDVASQIAENEAPPKPEYVFPPLDLLTKSKGRNGGSTEEELRDTAAKLQQVLKTFGVNVKVTNVTCGPSVTRYEMIPEMGVKVSKIVNLQDDIKLNLAVTDIRIEAPIPGKSAVGIEVPNKKPTPVLLRDLLETETFRMHKSNLAYAVGKDISGKTIVSDIAKMPHLLIAGSTGSGKSVFINTLIMSIIYKAKPEDVRLILVDPKVVELSVYNGIPHLFIPVVTDPKKAAGALNWAVAEMMKRYQKFADVHVRDLKGYNQRVASLPDAPDRPEKMPQIVVIVDELADLMMVSSSEVEDAIVRLTQLARAAGIHLVIATQRPSVDVITGLIKANMPSRIALSVSSGVDSRTILDQTGAEKLLGNGDMLFSPSNYKQPLRVQGAFVSDEEVASVVRFLKEQDGGVSPTEMEERIANVEKAAQNAGAAGGGSDTDELFVQAGKFIIEKDKASIGMLQRWFKIGFNRAARIMDQLADAGVVGPEEGTKPRKVLMTLEEFEEIIEGGDGSGPG